MSLRTIAVGTVAISFINVVRILSQFLILPILARFLTPHDYGLVALAMPFVLFAMMFADAGVAMSLVRTSLEDRKVWSTSFWLTVILGGVLAAILVGIAPLAAGFLNAPDLTLMVMVLGGVIWAQSISSVPGASLRKDSKFGTIAAIEIIALLTGIAAALAGAMQGWGAWALILQQLALYSVRLMLSVILSSFRPQLVFDFASVKEHLAFGRDVMGVGIVNFLANSTDNLIVGKFLGTAPTGIYAMATQFARMPGRLLVGPLQYVIYTHIAQMSDMRAIRSLLSFLTRILAMPIVLGMGMIAVAHGPIFRIVLSPKWEEAGFVFMTLMPASALQAITTLLGTFLMGIKRADLSLRIAVESGIIWITALLLAAPFGIGWVAVAYNCAVFIYFPRYIALALPALDCPKSNYLKALFLPVIITTLCTGSYYVFMQDVELSDWSKLFSAVSLGAAGLLCGFGIQATVILKEMRDLRALRADHVSD